MIRILVICALALALSITATVSQSPLILRGASVLAPDGESMLSRDIRIVGGKIVAVLPSTELKAEPGDRELDLSGLFVLPGLIDLHSHLLLHPYDETSWNDQVLRESLGERTIRATVAAKRTLLAGFTTLRDLGTEGAGYADVALRDSIRKGIIPGPRMFVASRALVASGCYGPSGFAPEWQLPKGAEVADGVTGVRIATRKQIAAGADWIKVYADYRRKPGDASTPTYSVDELRAIIDEATTAGVPVAAHASTDAAVRRAALLGVKTIEHGYQASAQTLKIMKERGVVLCPTLAANEAIVRYRGVNPVAAKRLNIARIMFKRALAAGVTIACGSDVGVFSHGDNARELELMVEYGMTEAQAIRSATLVAAEVLGRSTRLGKIESEYVADLIAVRANPLTDIAALRKVALVVAAGVVVRD